MQSEIDNILLVGDSCVGKTSLMVRQQTGEFIEECAPGEYANIYDFWFSTNKGLVKFGVIDVPGSDEYREFSQGHYPDAKFAIVMFDLGYPESLGNVRGWIEDIKEIRPDIPIILIGNKHDLGTKMEYGDVYKYIQSHIGSPLGLGYTEISVKTMYHVEKIFLKIGRHFLGRDLNYADDTEMPIIEGTTK